MPAASSARNTLDAEALFQRFQQTREAVPLGDLFDLVAIDRAGRYDARRPLRPWLFGILHKEAKARRRSARLRHFLSRGYRRLFRMLFTVPFRDPETGFQFFLREKIVPVARQTRDVGWCWDSEIMVLAHQANLHVVEVPCRFERRADKQSTVRIVHDVWHYLIAIRKFRRRMRRERV